jgi:hypothetical protein
LLVGIAWLSLPGASLLVYAAHYLRQGRLAVVVAILAFGFLLASRWTWIRVVFPAALLSIATHWVFIAWEISARRLLEGRSSARLLVILGSVSLVASASGVPFWASRLRHRYKEGLQVAPSAAFILTFTLLATVIEVVDRPLLLLGRFVPEGDWLEAVVLSTYAAWFVPRLLDARQSARWRVRAWWLFSAVFFTQFVLGIVGFDVFKMTPGEFHLPIPALILAGPLYRGEGYFMLILFASSVLLAGPAWCSHLCYIGAWDAWFSSRRKEPVVLPSWRQRARLSITVIVLGAAVLMRLAGVAPLAAGVVATAFGLLGVAVMAWWSSRTGTMAHCVTYCPIGVAATVLGRLSPFRLRISASCTSCGACSGHCRYDALGPIDIQSGRPGISCTLCGDCLETCDEHALSFGFLGLSAPTARVAFVVLVTSLHAATLGLARV